MIGQEKTAVFFHFTPGEDEREAQLLAANLHLHQIPFQLLKMLSAEESIFNSSINEGLNTAAVVEFPTPLKDFFFAAKVFAAAQAEEMALASGAEWMLWLDPDTLFVHSPALLHLAANESLAISPVHLANISAPAAEALPPYWQHLYEQCGVPSTHRPTIQSSVDNKWLHANYNTGLILTRPRNHLLRTWWQNFQRLYQDPFYEVFFEQDVRYKVFFHQAVLAATISARLSPQEIQLLPGTYNFPLHLLVRLPAERCPTSWEALNSLRYDRFDPPTWADNLPGGDPFSQWLHTEIAGLQSTNAL